MKREHPKIGIPADIRTVRQKLVRLKTSLLSDVLNKSGAMDHDMKNWSGQCRMAGPAFTLRVHPADILMVGQAVSVCPPGWVLVIDGQGELNTALWGSIITVVAHLKRMEGVVIDGAIRDLEEIRRERFPVFARAVVPNAGGAEYVGEMNVPIQCGGVAVNPGDWVVGDDDGVVVVTSARLSEAIKQAQKLLKVEKDIEKAVRAGGDLASILNYNETLQAKSRKTFLPQMRFKKGSS